MSKILDELDALLLDWECGELNDAGIERVREILRTDEAAQAHYVQQQMLIAAMGLEADSGLQNPLPIEEKQSEPTRSFSSDLTRSRRPRRRAGYWVAVAASVAFAVMSARLVYWEFFGETRTGSMAAVGRDSGEAVESTSQGVALLTRLVDVQWDDQPAMEVGEAISPGRFALASGFAQVEFFCGATVIIEGPAELEVVSPMMAKVRSGRLRAQVPPAARGFSLTVDDMTVVDLGTEFGLSVSDDGADVQVFDGEVELQSPADPIRRLTAGEAIKRTDSGEFEQSTIQPERFLDSSSMASRAEGQRQQNFERWKAWSQSFRGDPRVIAYYAFDEPSDWRRRLPSTKVPSTTLVPSNTPNQNDRELDGAIVGARQVKGRWPEKGGLEFKHPADRVRMQIPGEYSSLTFSCWVKIDSLDRWYNSLFLTDNYNQGEPHWQILDTGQLFFSVRVSSEDGGPEHREVLSPSFWDPSLSGKWIHLATTYDVPNQQVVHYLNGSEIHRESIPDHQLVPVTRFGPSTLCNWSSPLRPDAHFAIRNLNGSIDEFAILSEALDAEQIQEIYEYGKP